MAIHTQLPSDCSNISLERFNQPTCHGRHGDSTDLYSCWAVLEVRYSEAACLVKGSTPSARAAHTIFARPKPSRTSAILSRPKESSSLKGTTDERGVNSVEDEELAGDVADSRRKVPHGFFGG